MKNFKLLLILTIFLQFSCEEDPTSTLPSNPQSLSSAVSDQQVFLKWEAPGNTGNPALKEYSIYRGRNDNNYMKIGVTDINTQDFYDYNVTNNIAYNYYVTASNDDGESDPSNKIIAIPHILGTNGQILSMAIYQNSLIVGGDFSQAGGISANNIAKWNGTSWSPMGTGISSTVYAIEVSGDDLYASDTFNGGISKWNGSQWIPLSSGVNVEIFSIKKVGNDLYAGGVFTQIGSLNTNYIAKWNGSNWIALGNGVNSSVFSIASLNNEVFIGGDFTQATGIVANHIVKWNGSSWATLGTGVNARVNSICFKSNEIYVGGFFTLAGGVSANKIALWNGISWSAVGTDLNNSVSSILYDNSTLYAGGDFYSNSGGVSIWNNSSWSPLGSPFGSGNVKNIILYGNNVYAAGYFLHINSISMGNISKWDGSEWKGF